MNKIVVPIGDQKALVFQPQPGNVDDHRFADEVAQVAKTSPKSTQEFFERLVQLQETPCKQADTKK